MEKTELSSLVKKIIDKYFSENGENQRVIINDMIEAYSLHSINDIPLLIDKIGAAIKSEATKQKKIIIPEAVLIESKRRNVNSHNPLFEDLDIRYEYKNRKPAKHFKTTNLIEINKAIEQRKLFDKKISFLTYLKDQIQTESYFYNDAKNQSDAHISEAKEDGKNSENKLELLNDYSPEFADTVRKIVLQAEADFQLEQTEIKTSIAKKIKDKKEIWLKESKKDTQVTMMVFNLLSEPIQKVIGTYEKLYNTVKKKG